MVGGWAAEDWLRKHGRRRPHVGQERAVATFKLVVDNGSGGPVRILEARARRLGSRSIVRWPLGFVFDLRPHCMRLPLLPRVTVHRFSNTLEGSRPEARMIAGARAPSDPRTGLGQAARRAEASSG